MNPAQTRAFIRSGAYRLAYSSTETEEQKIAREQQREAERRAKEAMGSGGGGDLNISVSDGLHVGEKVG
jgi:hypothetical protein